MLCMVKFTEQSDIFAYYGIFLRANHTFAALKEYPYRTRIIRYEIKRLFNTYQEPFILGVKKCKGTIYM